MRSAAPPWLSALNIADPNHRLMALLMLCGRHAMDCRPMRVVCRQMLCGPGEILASRQTLKRVTTDGC